MSRVEAVFAAAFAVVVLGLATFQARPRGDSGEYVLMATAFARHLSPDIREDDVRSVERTEPGLARLMRRTRAGMVSAEPVLLGSIHRAPSGAYYSFHFWLYSLLAAPFVGVTMLVHASPVLALTLLNAGAVLAAAWYAFVSVRGVRGLAFAVAFLVSGTTYYLPWTGPEALTASAALVSALAAMQGRMGVALLAAGVASAQNPGALALAAMALGWWFLLQRRPGSRLLPGAGAAPLNGRLLALALGGACVAGASPLFFLVVFGEPSLIAKYTTDRSLATGSRAFSLLFDLNQGMLIGVPGVMLGILGATIAAVRQPAPAVRHTVLFAFALAWTTVLLMLLPSLTTHNWNSGCAVFVRYSYWSAMPLLATLLGIAGCSRGRLGGVVATSAFVVQLVPVVLNGVTGDRVWYTRHNGIARFVMERAPALYNPEPEIFLERTLRRETSAESHPVVAWPNEDSPKKLLVTRPGRIRARQPCDGGAFEAASVVDVGGGKRYVNGPFRCDSPR
jgi:hypothetical protein